MEEQIKKVGIAVEILSEKNLLQEELRQHMEVFQRDFWKPFSVVYLAQFSVNDWLDVWTDLEGIACDNDKEYLKKSAEELLSHADSFNLNVWLRVHLMLGQVGRPHYLTDVSKVLKFLSKSAIKIESGSDAIALQVVNG